MIQININTIKIKIWKIISKIRLPFSFHLFWYKKLFPNWQTCPAPAWFPDNKTINEANLTKIMHNKNIKTLYDFHQFSINDIGQFWETVVNILKIDFEKSYSKVIDLKQGTENPIWFCDSKLNIVKSCFKNSKDMIAIISQKESGEIRKITYHDLDIFSNKIANSISSHFKSGDALAIIMPMNIEAIAIYLAILKTGCVAVSIADSFSKDEIATRLKIAKAKAVFTQDMIIRDNKKINLLDRIPQENDIIDKIIVISEKNNQNETKNVKFVKDQKISSENQNNNLIISWSQFLSENNEFPVIICNPDDPINILFSSGTTGDPKAIPWNHTTPIKCASDAFFHHNLKPYDRFCWPTNLGWMMGPWLIFATMINKATIVLYDGSPNTRAFGQCVQNHKVTHLGVIPSLVNHWRTTECMTGLDWTNIKLFSSTGESSNPLDMLYLMHLASFRPIIEYCGGTEIGGAYITSTVIEPSAPSAFTIAAMGIDFIILDEQGKPSHFGEIALIPPSLGLSLKLLNKDHHQVYYQDMPQINDKFLRRHGDQAMKYSNGYYRLQGRSDDTMNLSGIKVSSTEIERVLNTHTNIYETAAIAIEPKEGGPSQLIIYAVLKDKKITENFNNRHDKNINKTHVNKSMNNDNMNNENNKKKGEQLKKELQTLIKEKLNPLFKIYNVVIVTNLPRTASNKVIRRQLRNEYLQYTKQSFKYY